MDKLQYDALTRLAGAILTELERHTRALESIDRRDQAHVEEMQRIRALRPAPMHPAEAAVVAGAVPILSDAERFATGAREALEHMRAQGIPQELLDQATRTTAQMGAAIFPETADTEADQCETRARKLDGPGYTCCQLKRGHAGECRSLGGSILIPGVRPDFAALAARYPDPARVAAIAGDPYPVPADECAACRFKFERFGFNTMPETGVRVCFACGHQTPPVAASEEEYDAHIDQVRQDTLNALEGIGGMMRLKGGGSASIVTGGDGVWTGFTRHHPGEADDLAAYKSVPCDGLPALLAQVTADLESLGGEDADAGPPVCLDRHPSGSFCELEPGHTGAHKDGALGWPPDGEMGEPIEGEAADVTEAVGVIEAAGDMVREIIGDDLADDLARALPVVLAGDAPRCRSTYEGRRCLRDHGHDGNHKGSRRVDGLPVTDEWATDASDQVLCAHAGCGLVPQQGDLWCGDHAGEGAA